LEQLSDAALAEYFPGKQLLQTLAPAELAFPASQSTHILSASYFPAGQVEPHTAAPAPLTVPGAHASQLLFVSLLANLPAAQLVHSAAPKLLILPSAQSLQDAAAAEE